MSRSEWITIYVTVLVSGIAYFESGPKLAGAVALSAGLVFLGVHLIGKNVHPPAFSQPVPPAVPAPVSLPASRAKARTRYFVRTDVRGEMVQVPPNMDPPYEGTWEQITSNVKYVGCRTANLGMNPAEGQIYYETTLKGDLLGFLVCFRNDPIEGEEITTAHDVRADVRFSNYYVNEDEDMATPDGVVWLGSRREGVDLVPGGNEECVIALIQSQRQFWVPWKRKPTVRGDYVEDYANAFVTMPYNLTIILHDSKNHLVTVPVPLELTRTQDGPQGNDYGWAALLDSPTRTHIFSDVRRSSK